MVSIHGDIMISPDAPVRLIKILICSNGFETDQLFSKILQFVKKNAFFLFIEIKFARKLAKL